MQPRLKIQAEEQTIGAVHTGTWSSPAHPPHWGLSLPPPHLLQGSRCLLCTPPCVSASPWLFQCPQEQSLGRTRGSQGADDRPCPLLKKAKPANCTSSEPSYTSPDPTPTLCALGARASLDGRMHALGTQPPWPALIERLLWARC